MTIKNKANYTDLTHQAVRDSPEPLPFSEILRRVHELAPITTRNPKGTIRAAIGQSRLIRATGAGNYGWMPRLLTGSVLRHTLSAEELAGPYILFGEELREALWPTFFEIQKRSDRGPVQLRLPDKDWIELPLEFLGPSRWGTGGPRGFFAWLKKQRARTGDHLIFRALNGENRQYSIEFQRRSSRDEGSIATRNREIVAEGLAFLKKRQGGAAIWDIAAHLLATGQYRHPVPPDPLSEIWTREVWESVMPREVRGGGWMLAGGLQQFLGEEPSAAGLFGIMADSYDPDNPRDLPREYQVTGRPRLTRPSRLAAKGAVKTFTLRVKHRALPQVWREIEIAEDQTLEDLHLMIQRAYDWRDDHLYSFFMSGQAWDKQSEIGSPWSECSRHTHQATLGNLKLEAGRTFLYLFDYGDNHEFDVTVTKINPAAPRGNYPKIVGKQGKAPEQYPDYDGYTGEMSWDPYFRE